MTNHYMVQVKTSWKTEPQQAKLKLKSWELRCVYSPCIDFSGMNTKGYSEQVICAKVNVTDLPSFHRHLLFLYSFVSSTANNLLYSDLLFMQSLILKHELTDSAPDLFACLMNDVTIRNQSKMFFFQSIFVRIYISHFYKWTKNFYFYYIYMDSPDERGSIHLKCSLQQWV